MSNPKKLNLIGLQLQRLRKWRGWSQSDLSAKLYLLGWKISRDSIAQMEITTKRITDCDLIFLAKALDVKITNFSRWLSRNKGSARNKIPSFNEIMFAETMLE